MENHRKKNQIEIPEIKSSFSQTTNTLKGHSSRFQVEDRFSELKEKREIKEKKRRNLSQYTQEL
jgi:hypothetical protein